MTTETRNPRPDGGGFPLVDHFAVAYLIATSRINGASGTPPSRASRRRGVPRPPGAERSPGPSWRAAVRMGKMGPARPAIDRAGGIAATGPGDPAFPGPLSPRERVGVRVVASPPVSGKDVFDRRRMCHDPHPRPLSRGERGGRPVPTPESIVAPGGRDCLESTTGRDPRRRGDVIPMKVLVTGAAGFIGSTLADRLLDRGDEVVGVRQLRPVLSRVEEAFPPGRGPPRPPVPAG